MFNGFKLISYAVGDIIEQRTTTGMKRYVLVQAREEDIKNGCAGFEGVEVNINGKETGLGAWGYDDQVLRVVKAAQQ